MRVSIYAGLAMFFADLPSTALNEDGTYRDNVFYATIGEAYIHIAFATAAAAGPDAKLYYNDYSSENSETKFTAAQSIVKLIQSYGAKIDGVGMQAHFIVGSTPSQDAQTTNMNAFVDLGVEVAITELDIRTTTLETDSALTQQAADYAATVVHAWRLRSASVLLYGITPTSTSEYLPLSPDKVLRFRGMMI
jgi:endo-1,4-beta-xylanase